MFCFYSGKINCQTKQVYFPTLLFFFLMLVTVLLSTSALTEEVASGNKSKFWHMDKTLTGPVQLLVSVPDQTMNVYRNGKHIIKTRISSGRPGHNTPGGIFSILQKRSEHYSNLFDNAPMPYMQRLTWSGVALHAGNVSRKFASHGCIRMPHNFARNLFRYTRRGAHVIITHEEIGPKEIVHSNLIAPTPRPFPVPKKALAPDLIKADPLAVTKLQWLKDERANTRKVLATTKQLLKEQRLDVKKRWKIYSQKNKRTAALTYKHSRLLKKIRWTKKHLIQTRENKENQVRKTLSWLKIAENKQDIFYDQLLSLNKDIARLRQERREAIAEEKNTYKLKKKISILRWKHTRLLKRISRAEKNVRNAKRALDARQKSVASQIEKTENQLVDLDNQLIAFNVDFLPLKDELDRTKKAFDEAQARSKNTSLTYQKLQRKFTRLNGDIQRTRKLVRLQKKPLRILLTKSNRKHKVRDVQQSLVDMGYKLGAIDGLYGRETIAVIKRYQKDNALKVSGLINDDLISSIRSKLGKEPLKSGHIYVRQGFKDIYNAPVGITDPALKLGTHFYTVLNFNKQDNQARWNVVTIKNRKQIAALKSRKIVTGSTPADVSLQTKAAQALDRINLPQKVRVFLSRRLTPGSSLIISDKGFSHETGQGTDFIVLAR